MIITIKLLQGNSLTNSILKDLKSFDSTVSFLKLFHEFTMLIEKEYLLKFN